MATGRLLKPQRAAPHSWAALTGLKRFFPLFSIKEDMKLCVCRWQERGRAEVSSWWMATTKIHCIDVWKNVKNYLKYYLKLNEISLEYCRKGIKLICPKEATKGGRCKKHKRKRERSGGDVEWKQGVNFSGSLFLYLHNKVKKDSSLGAGDTIQQLRTQTCLAEDTGQPSAACNSRLVGFDILSFVSSWTQVWEIPYRHTTHTQNKNHVFLCIMAIKQSTLSKTSSPTRVHTS